MNTTSIAGATLTARSISTASVIDAASAMCGPKLSAAQRTIREAGSGLELLVQLREFGVAELCRAERPGKRLGRFVGGGERHGHQTAHSDSPSAFSYGPVSPKST